MQNHNNNFDLLISLELFITQNTQHSNLETYLLLCYARWSTVVAYSARYSSFVMEFSYA